MRNMKSSILIRLSLLFAIFYVCLNSGHSELITFPRDTDVLVNQPTYFNCSTSILSEQIHWYHNRVGENRTEYVYYKGQFNKIYADRYSIEINTKTGEYNLIIRSVQAGDAGRYVCQDDVGLGNSSSAELIVLESTPTCRSSMKSDGFVGPNSCNLPLETLQLSCSVSYVGNIPPILQWKMSVNDAPILRGIVNDYSGKRAMANLTMSSTVEMNGDVFTCGTTRSEVNKQLTCSTDRAKINYAIGQSMTLNIAKGNAITCSANASVPCTYRWFYGNDAQNPVSYNQVLTTNRLGNHSCEASCPINGISCTFVAMRIIVLEQEPSKTSLISNILIPTIIVILLIIACFIIFRKLKEKHANRTDRPITAESLPLHETTVQDRERLPEICKSNPVLIETIKTKVGYEAKIMIRGLTILDKKLFVVTASSSKIEVYDSITFKFSRQFNIAELHNPSDIASCKKNNCLYIVDFRYSRRSKGILRVDSSGKIIKIWLTGDELGCVMSIDQYGKLIKESPTEDGNGGIGLSVAYESNIILTLQQEKQLIEYSPDGELISKINLSDVGIYYAWHAIKLTNGHFVICHGLDDDLHRVCIVDAEGKLMKSFGGTLGCSIGQMFCPVYLSVNGNGFVFVADKGNHRVLLLNSNLEFKREILTREKHELRYPQRILLDESTNRLFLAEWGFSFVGLIKIFQF